MIKMICRLVLISISILLMAGLKAQTPSIKVMPTVNSGVQRPSPYIAEQSTNTMKSYRFSGREVSAKLFLSDEWVVVDNVVTLANTSTRFIPKGQTASAFNQRIGIHELPTWVTPTRLGKDYVLDIMSECATGQLKPLEKGRINQLTSELLLLECADSAAQTATLAIAALVQAPLANVVLSRMVRLPLNDPSPAKTVANEIDAFKRLVAQLTICTASTAAACR